jgi:hypothetical protein
MRENIFKRFKKIKLIDSIKIKNKKFFYLIKNFFFLECHIDCDGCSSLYDCI